MAAESGDEAHLVAWVVFLVSVGVLLALDISCLQTPLSAGRMSFQTALKLTSYWILAGLAFDLFVMCCLGFDASVGFLQGFMLECMLSFDNLFVFHLVFAYYCTPEALIYRALYFGIAGAILVWSGVRTVNDLDDEDTADPTKNHFIRWVTKHLPVSDNYEPHGHFFITVAEVECQPPRSVSLNTWEEEAESLANFRSEAEFSAGLQASTGLPRLESFEGSSLLDAHRNLPSSRSAQGSPPPGQTEQDSLRRSSIDSVDGLSHEVPRKPARLKRKASLLLLVVIAVWVVDLVFAVDSVASKLASVSDIYLNCSSSAFAMLSLRTMYFAMEALTQTFHMLKYGMSIVLILLGLRLVCSHWFSISNGACFVVIIMVVCVSMASSMWSSRLRDTCQRLDVGVLPTVAEDDETAAVSPSHLSQGLMRGGLNLNTEDRRQPGSIPMRFDRALVYVDPDDVE